jgi:iron complex outermembrane receptor protein
LKPRARLRLSLFDEHVRDALLSQTAPLVPGSTTLFSYVQNVGLTRTRGAELVFEARGFLLPKLDLSGSVTLADARVLRDPAFAAAEGRHIPQVPALRAALALTWRESDKASFTLAGRYSSRSFATIDNSDTVTHTYQGFDPYLVIDARAAFRLGRGWEAAIAADNVTDRRYFVFHPFPQRTVHAEIGWRW